MPLVTLQRAQGATATTATWFCINVSRADCLQISGVGCLPVCHWASPGRRQQRCRTHASAFSFCQCPAGLTPTDAGSCSTVSLSNRLQGRAECKFRGQRLHIPSRTSHRGGGAQELISKQQSQIIFVASPRWSTTKKEDHTVDGQKSATLCPQG